MILRQIAGHSYAIALKSWGGELHLHRRFLRSVRHRRNVEGSSELASTKDLIRENIQNESGLNVESEVKKSSFSLDKPIDVQLAESWSWSFGPYPTGRDASKIMCSAIMKMQAPTLLATIAEHHKKMDKIHLTLSLKRLRQICNELPAENVPNYLTALRFDQRFQVVCALIAMKAQHLEPNILADVLKFASFLGLGSNHPSMQVFLQVARTAANDMALDQLVHIAYSASVMAPTNLTRQIILICQSLFPLRSDISILTLWELITALDLFGPTLPIELCRRILYQIRLDCDLISYRYAVVILRAFGKMDTRLMKIKEIKSRCVNKICQHMNKLDHIEIKSVLASFHGRLRPDFLLLRKIGERSVAEETLENKIDIVLSLHKLNFFHEPSYADLLSKDGLRFECVKSVETLTSLLQFVGDISHEMDLRKYQTILDDLLIGLDKNSLTLTPKQALDSLMAVHQLGLNCPSLREPVFDNLPVLLDQDDVQTLDEEKPPKRRYEGDHLIENNLYKLNFIHQMSSCDPETQIDDILSNLIQEIPRELSPLTGCLETVVEDEHNLLHCPSLKDGLIADHLLLNHDGSETAVLVLQPRMFWANTGQLKGYAAWYGKLLQRKGYLVSMVNLQSWDRIEERDKLDFLKYKLKVVKEEQDLKLVGTTNI